MDEQTTKARRNALALAAALTVTVFTAVAGLAGLVRNVPPTKAVAPIVASAVQQPAPVAREVEDD